MRVLITGATGFIGRHVAARLLEQGDTVRALVRGSSDDWKIQKLIDMGAETVEGDVTDVAALRLAMRDVDAVVHGAAIVRFGRIDADQMHQVNVIGTENVMRTAKQGGVRRVLHISSIAALGVHSDTEADETTPHHGDYGSPYERSKHIASLVADEYAENGLHVVQALPAVVFGRSDPNFGVFFKGYVRRRYPVLPGPDTVLSLVHVADLARGIVMALEKGKRGERFIFTQANISLADLFDRLEAATGIPGPRIKVKADVARGVVRAAAAASRFTPWKGTLTKRSADILGKKRTYSNRKAREVLRWDPGDFEARLADTARYYAVKYGPRSAREALKDQIPDPPLEAKTR